jgi:N-acetylneuraminic acid mutarotase
MYIIVGTLDDNTTDTTLKYNSIQDAWSEVAPMPAPRDSFAACAYMNYIYVFGGNDEDGEDQASVFKYDTEAGEWSTQAPMPTVCSCHSVSLIDDEMYIVGAGNFGREVLRFNFATSTYGALSRRHPIKL